MCFQESGPARSQAGQAVAPSFAGESGILVHAFRHYHEAATLKAAMIATPSVNAAPGVPR